MLQHPRVLCSQPPSPPHFLQRDSMLLRMDSTAPAKQETEHTPFTILLCYLSAPLEFSFWMFVQKSSGKFSYQDDKPQRILPDHLNLCMQPKLRQLGHARGHWQLEIITIPLASTWASSCPVTPPDCSFQRIERTVEFHEPCFGHILANSILELC